MAREFKDSLFRFIFGSAANFGKLYFWAAKKELPKNSKPYKTTKFLTSVFANDIAFTTPDDRLIIFFEHQSTNNPNMALRCCLYYFDFVLNLIKRDKKKVIKLFSSSL
ncbi:MAG: hypothetical protein B0D92_02745, partial [Spirochaeta sp. LUC14_002_19_P3]